MRRGTSAEVSLHIDSSPKQLYDLVSDVRRMGERSPECRACEWIDGATGASVGARFKGTNRRGLARWTTTLQVLAAHEGREFAFVTFHNGHELTKWTYRFEPDNGGTTVTEAFELLADVPWYLSLTERLLMGIKDRRADLQANMRETLQRLRAAVEPADHRRPAQRRGPCAPSTTSRGTWV